MKTKMIPILVALCTFSLGTAYAAPLKVTAIQWVQGKSFIPHPAVNGKETRLQAIAEGGNCGQYQTRWDVNGDGDFDDNHEGNTDYGSGGYFTAIEKNYQYPHVENDTIIYPKVEVVCGNEKATSIMPVLIYVDKICTNYSSNPNNANCSEDQSLLVTRQINADRAVDRGLWYLFKQFSHSTGDGKSNANAHICNLSSVYATGQALNSFLRRGHGYGQGRETDPYYRHVTQCGLHSLLNQMVQGDFNNDISDIGVDGKLLRMPAAGDHAYSYLSTSWTEPLAGFGNSDYISPVGGNGVVGQRLRDIGQDCADALVECMYESGGNKQSWNYYCNNPNNHQEDGSTNGWAPEALRLFERKFGTVVDQNYKSGQQSFLQSHCPNGYCTYHPGSQPNNSPKLAGNVLVSYGWVKDQNFDEGDAHLVNSLQAVTNWYHRGTSADGCGGGGIMSECMGIYYVYAAVKGLRSFVPELTYLSDGTHWSNEFTDYFLTGQNNNWANDGSATQNDDGSWNWAGTYSWGDSIDQNTRTGLIIQTIQSWLEVSSYARAEPQQVTPGFPVKFDHSWSYSLDPSASISKYKWNVRDFPYTDTGMAACPQTQTDYNLDGDTDDGGERYLARSGCIDENHDGICESTCREDLNNNGTVDDGEQYWEFETEVATDQFEYAYQDNLGWGDVKKIQVTLRTIDDQGRFVDDSNSVEVKISKFNNKPLVRVHATGNDYVYHGVPGGSVEVDLSNSIDPDAGQEHFPGGDGRPEGQPDFISLIAVDLNGNGSYDDNGEVIFTANSPNDPTPSVLGATANINIPVAAEPGSLSAVSVRVCDDGQWTNQCQDAHDGQDCSKCAVSSITLGVPDLNQAPIIDENAYQGSPGRTIQLDLRGIVDPDMNKVAFAGGAVQYGTGNRPAGIPESLKVVYFDYDLDGTIDTDKNVAAGDVIDFTIPANAVEDEDIIFISVLACDDGQWSEVCIDGNPIADCSKCTSGQIPVRVVGNVEPPTINDVSTSVIPATGQVALLVDAHDPEGSPLTFTYTVISGAGDFNDNNPAYYTAQPIANEDFVEERVDRVQVVAFDGFFESDPFEFDVPVPFCAGNDLTDDEDGDGIPLSCDYCTLNGVVEAMEACDDGNEFNCDECTSSCKAGPNFDFVAVQGGEFEMGNDRDRYARPAHTVNLQGFWMSRKEVTNYDYMLCVEDEVCTAPNTRYAGCTYGRDGFDNHPVNCVEWQQAMDFTQWCARGVTLPTEAQWEFAARSQGQVKNYAAGNTVSCDDTVYQNTRSRSSEGCGDRSTHEVCTTGADQTDDGLCDMSGNVWEWMLDAYTTYRRFDHENGAAYINNGRRGINKVIRGGSWRSKRTSELKTTYRRRRSKYSEADQVGFRVVCNDGNCLNP
jgi:iron(II)-dependent oxidoreductase